MDVRGGDQPSFGHPHGGHAGEVMGRHLEALARELRRHAVEELDGVTEARVVERVAPAEHEVPARLPVRFDLDALVRTDRFRPRAGQHHGAALDARTFP